MGITPRPRLSSGKRAAESRAPLVNGANPMIWRANPSPELMAALLVRRHGPSKLDAKDATSAGPAAARVRVAARTADGRYQDTKERIMAKTLIASRPTPHLPAPAASGTTAVGVGTCIISSEIGTA